MDFATKAHKQTLRAFLEEISPGGHLWDKIVVKGDFSVMTVRNAGEAELFLVPRDLTAVIKSWTKPSDIIAGGLFVGRLKVSRVFPSQAFVEHLFTREKEVINITTVTSSEEKAISYGRDLTLSSVETALVTSPYYVLINEDGECLALARINKQRVSLLTSFGNYLKEDNPAVVL